MNIKNCAKIPAKHRAVLALVAILAESACITTPVSAQTPAATPAPPPARGIPYELALEAARLAIDTCKGLDQKVAVSVLDSAGELRLLLAADEAPTRGVQNSALKAKSSVAFKVPSGQVAELAKTNAAVADGLAANPTWLARAGAVPVSVKGTLIGAIGVGGARGSEKDEACAVAALDKIQSRLY